MSALLCMGHFSRDRFVRVSRQIDSHVQPPPEASCSVQLECNPKNPFTVASRPPGGTYYLRYAASSEAFNFPFHSWGKDGVQPAEMEKSRCMMHCACHSRPSAICLVNASHDGPETRLSSARPPRKVQGNGRRPTCWPPAVTTQRCFK